MRLRRKTVAVDDNAGVTREPDDVITARLISLGSVMESSAFMEYTLRNAFCSLVGSKYAAIVAGGQPVGWLIEQCRALTDAHRGMPRQHREAIKAALERCRAANERRNHLVHGVKTASRAAAAPSAPSRAAAAPAHQRSRRGRLTPSTRPPANSSRP